MGNRFSTFTKLVSSAAGSWQAFALAVLLVLGWACTGPVFGWSDTWQLIINTGTTIVTFIMVFLLQYAQNTDTRALHVKIDALISGCERASNKLIDLEHSDDAEIDAARAEVLARKGDRPG